MFKLSAAFVALALLHIVFSAPVPPTQPSSRRKLVHLYNIPGRMPQATPRDVGDLSGAFHSNQKRQSADILDELSSDALDTVLGTILSRRSTEYLGKTVTKVPGTSIFNLRQARQDDGDSLDNSLGSNLLPSDLLNELPDIEA